MIPWGLAVSVDEDYLLLQDSQGGDGLCENC